MKTTTALIIEPSDMTKDGNVKREVFEAIANSNLVIHEGRVIKYTPSSPSSAPQEPVKRVRRAKAPKPLLDAPQAPTEPSCAPAPTPAEDDA
jgi:hypothetical protein